MTDPNEAGASVPVSDAVRELYIATSGMLDAADKANIRKGNWDGTTNMQTFARFEQAIREDERERAAKVAKSTNAPQPESLEQCAIVKCIYAHGEKIAAAIRQSKGRP